MRHAVGLGTVGRPVHRDHAAGLDVGGAKALGVEFAARSQAQRQQPAGIGAGRWTNRSPALGDARYTAGIAAVDAAGAGLAAALTDRSSSGQGMPMLLEQKRRLSQSRIWQWQRRYYTSEEPQPGSAVRCRTTSPATPLSLPLMPRWCWASCAMCHASRGRPRRDAAALHRRARGGVGRFAYHFITQLGAALGARTLPVPPIRYVLTDLAEANVEYYRSHRCNRSLRPGCSTARASMSKPTPSCSYATADLRSPGSLQQPLLCIANYVFDSVPQDAFFVENSRLHESPAVAARSIRRS